MNLQRALLVVGVAAAAGLTIPAAASAQAAACAGADTPVTAANAAAARTAMTCLLNNERTARGLPALASNPALEQASQAHAADMVARNYRDINAPDPAPQGTTPRDRATLAGYPAGQAVYGVWLAQGRTPRTNALEVMKQGGLCSALIDPAYTDVGVGAAASSTGPRFSISFGGAATPTGANASCPANRLVTPASPGAAAQTLAGRPPSVIAGQLGLPGTNACQSRRAFFIRVREPQGIRLRSASLTLANRRSVARRSNGRLRALVDLRGFSRGTFRLKIVATTTTGVKLTGYRTYRTCAGSANL
jgi:uncharacterized protein YkwD